MESTGRRTLTGFPWRVVQVTGFVFSVIFTYSTMNGAIVYIGPRNLTPFSIKFPLLSLYSDHIIIPLFIFFTSVLVFLLYPAAKGHSPRERPSAVDWLWCLLPSAAAASGFF